MAVRKTHIAHILLYGTLSLDERTSTADVLAWPIHCAFGNILPIFSARLYPNLLLWINDGTRFIN